MLDWLAVAVQRDRVIVLREQVERASPFTANPPAHHLPLWTMTSTRTRRMLNPQPLGRQEAGVRANR